MICPWKDMFVSIAVLFFELIDVLNSPRFYSVRGSDVMLPL